MELKSYLEINDHSYKVISMRVNMLVSLSPN